MDIVPSNFNGVMALSDLHGNSNGFEKAINFANINNLFIICLGDIIDYGDHNIKCINMLYNLIKNKKGLTIIGNHDSKFHRYITKSRTNSWNGSVSNGMEKTINEFNLLSLEERIVEEDKFIEIINDSFHVINYGSYYFAHGAINHKIITKVGTARFVEKSAYASLCYYGQTTGKYDENGMPERIYNWVDEIPEGISVVVGHDVRQSNEPLIQYNKQKGRAIFIDTGSSKKYKYPDGHLSALIGQINNNDITNISFWSELDDVK